MNRKNICLSGFRLGLVLFVMSVFAVLMAGTVNIQAADEGAGVGSSSVKRIEFAGMLLSAIGAKCGSSTEEIKAAAESIGILKTNEFKYYEKNIRREEALAMLVRADGYLKSLQRKKSGKWHTDFILKYRISDGEKASARYRKYIAKAYELGLVKGSSDGKYTKTRHLSPRKYVSLREAKNLMERLTNSEKRYTLSESFVLCKENDLPKNSRFFNCIYGTYGNSFYDWEMYFMKAKKGAYGRSLYDLEQIGADEEELMGFGRLRTYAAPCDLWSYTGFAAEKNRNDEILKMYDIEAREKLGERISEYLKVVFNADYRSLPKQKKSFQKAVVDRSILSQWYAEGDNIPEINRFIKKAEENETVLESAVIAVDTDNMYACGEWLYVRCYVRWRPVSGKVTSGTFNELDGLIFTVNGGLSDELNLMNVKTGKWHDSFFDVMIKPKTGKIAGTIINDYYHETNASVYH